VSAQDLYVRKTFLACPLSAVRASDGIRTLNIPYSYWGRTFTYCAGGRASSCMAALTRDCGQSSYNV